MGNFFKMKHIFRTNKSASPTQNQEDPRRHSRILKEIKRTGKTVREIFRKGIRKGNPQPLDKTCAHHNAEQSTEGSVQYQPFNDTNVVEPNSVDQPAEESLHLPQSNDNNNAARDDAEQLAEAYMERCQSQDYDDATHQNTEQHVEASVQQTPKAVGNDSGYNSPQDETSAWEKILEMREREHQNDLAAMQDEHDDEMKDLRKDLTSEIKKKELLQKRVKKEVLAKREFKQQLDTLQEEHRAAVEASGYKDKEIEAHENEAIALRARLQEMEIGFQNKEKSYLESLQIQGEVVKAKEEEVVDLRLRMYDMNRELLSKENFNQGALSEVGTNALNLQSREHAAIAQWKTRYHQAFEEAHGMWKQLAICANQREQAMEFAQDFQAQLELAKSANVKLSAEVASKQLQIEVDGRYHEQIRGQNYDLQKRVNESIAAVAQLKYKKAKAEQEAAEDVKDLTRKLDNRTAELSALEATRAEWQADPEGVLLTPSDDVEINALVLALAKRFQLTLNENDSLKQRMAVQEKEYYALNGQLRHAKAQRDGLSQSVAEKAEEVTSLKNNIFELETKVLSREMDEETAKQAEPLYLQAMEEVAQKEGYISQCLAEIRRLREAALENDEDVVDSEARVQLDQARKAALQNRQQHVAKVEKLKDLIEKLYQRILQLEATLAAAGRTIEEPDEEGHMLKAQCARVLGYVDDESDSETGSLVHTTPGPETSQHIGTESQSGEPQVEFATQSNGGTNHTVGNEQPQPHPQNAADNESKAQTKHSSDSSATIIARRFVMRSLAEAGTRIRVLGESSSPAATPTPDNDPPRAENGEDTPSDRSTGSDEDDGSGDLQLYQPPPFLVASLAWVKKNRPFAHGEPVGDDQFGKEALRARR